MLNEKIMLKVSTLFKVLSDPTRIKIIYLLKDSNLSVNEIKDILNMTQSAVSHQLRVLKDTNLVKYERSGKNVIYKLADNHVYEIFNQAIEHVCEGDNKNEWK